MPPNKNFKVIIWALVIALSWSLFEQESTKIIIDIFQAMGYNYRLTVSLFIVLYLSFLITITNE